MANGFVNSTDNYQEETDDDVYEAKNSIIRKYEAKQKVEEMFQEKIFGLLGLIDDD